jgi:BlaI family penicillinase repressor
MGHLPDLSRFELQCLRKLWSRREATVRDIHQDLDDPPSYSTVRKIIERLEEKGAVKRVRKDGRAWVYCSVVHSAAMLHKEIRRFLDIAFDGAAAPLVAHLADMKEVSLEDIRELERQIEQGSRPPGDDDRDDREGG